MIIVTGFLLRLFFLNIWTSVRGERWEKIPLRKCLNTDTEDGQDLRRSVKVRHCHGEMLFLHTAILSSLPWNRELEQILSLLDFVMYSDTAVRKISKRLASMCLCIYVCIHLCIYLCNYLCIHLSIYLSMYLCIHLAMYLSMYPSIFVSIYVSMYYVSI